MTNQMSIFPELTKLNLMLLSANQSQPQDILKEVVKSARGFLKADIVSLYEYSKDNGTFFLPPEERVKTKVISEILNSQNPLYAADFQSTDDLTGNFDDQQTDLPNEKFIARDRIRYRIEVPLKYKDEVVAVLFVGFRTPPPKFDDDQQELLDLFASIAGLAIYNSRLRVQGLNAKNGNFIFLSYAREDFDRVMPIYKKIIERGYNVWIDDEKLLPGQDWDHEIQEAIRRSKVFIACLSNNSVNKKGYFQKELKKGLDIYEEYPEGKIFLIPLLLEACKIPSIFEHIQWCDMSEDNGLMKLFQSIESSFSRATSA